jgi:hypothetical protein
MASISLHAIAMASISLQQLQAMASIASNGKHARHCMKCHYMLATACHFMHCKQWQAG